MRRIAIFAAVLWLAGCNATMPQQARGPDMGLDDPSRPCFEGIGSRPELAVIVGKIPLMAASSPTVEMLNDTSKAAEDERKAISYWAKTRAECIALGRDFRARFGPPGYVVAFDQGQADVLNAIAELYGLNVTYGQFNATRQRIALKMQADFSNVAQAARHAAENQAAADRAARLQAMQMMDALRPPAPQFAPPPPIQVPRSLYCNSYRNGNQVQTTCN